LRIQALSDVFFNGFIMGLGAGVGIVGMYVLMGWVGMAIVVLVFSIATFLYRRRTISQFWTKMNWPGKPSEEWAKVPWRKEKAKIGPME
jgi:hypothetical protein